ncbi:MAG TPA: cytochrome c [Acidimicrobiia bacterium]|nr:cytochrome c [Acidimicrobiia bacterium]
MKRSFPVALAVAAVVAALAAPVSAADEEDGRAVYEQACAACHQADGRGIPGSFPPLAGNPNAADASYVESVIRNGLAGPITVNGETYDGVMAAITTLTDAQIVAVSQYVAGLAGEGGGEDPEPAPIAEPTAGDAALGESLFLGATVFDNGAPACAACHGAAGFDQLGGSGLGPDLTHMYSRFGGEQGTAAALATPPSATMTPLFADNPLTETEIADLTAFFAEVDQEAPGGGFDMFWIWGVVVLAALLGFLALFVSKPSGTYLEKLRSST